MTVDGIEMTLKQGGTVSSRQKCWVLGGGRFGRRAVELLRKSEPDTEIVVIDRLPDRDLPIDIEIVCADGVEWFTENFSPTARVNKIVPALPIHLAADWIIRKFTNEQRIVRSVEIPDELIHHFPHPVLLSPSRLVTSYADFLCPSNCSEPDDFCTYTKKPRPLQLDRLLETIMIADFVPLILTSRQFAPGVGGFYPEDLWILLEKARLLSGSHLLIGTACKCHGIVDGLRHNM